MYAKTTLLNNIALRSRAKFYLLFSDRRVFDTKIVNVYVAIAGLNGSWENNQKESSQI